MINRRVVSKLNVWRTSTSRKPLLFMGVRQVGKTTLVREFGKSNFRQLHEIDFEEQRTLREVFKRDLDPQRIISELEIALKSKIDLTQDLLFFDEIQACPEALTSLKYFYDKVPQLAVIGAGSLLGVALNKSSFPVGKVDRLDLYPLNFEEYLEAAGNRELFANFDSYLERGEMPSVLHKRLWDEFKKYLITGGLPEIVSESIGNDNDLDRWSSIRKKQKGLVRDYLADMAKHSGKVNAMHLERVFNAVAEQVSSVQDDSVARFRFAGVVPGVSQYSRLANAFDWLLSAGLIFKSPVVDQVSTPLASQVSERLFKAFVFDIGILGALVNLDPLDLIQYDFGTYKGFIVENFVAMELAAMGVHPTFSWVGRESEIEFLIETQGQVVPIEVKSGVRTRSRSLKEYINKFNPKNSILLSGKSFFFTSKENKAPSMAPVYAVSKIIQLLAK